MARYRDLMDAEKLQKLEPCSDCGSTSWTVADRGTDERIRKCSDCHYYDPKTDRLVPMPEKVH